MYKMITIGNLKTIIEKTNASQKYWSISKDIAEYINNAVDKKEAIQEILDVLVLDNSTLENCKINLVLICTISKQIYWIRNSDQASGLFNTFSPKLSYLAECLRDYGTSLDKAIELITVFELLESEIEIGGSDIVWIPFESSYETVNTDFIHWLFENHHDFLFKIDMQIELSMFNPEALDFDECLSNVVSIYNAENCHLNDVTNLPGISF